MSGIFNLCHVLLFKLIYTLYLPPCYRIKLNGSIASTIDTCNFCYLQSKAILNDVYMCVFSHSVMSDSL